MNGQVCVIAEGEDTTKILVHRFFGILIDTTPERLVIQLADGRTIQRESHRVARYVQPPRNWEKLYKQQEVHKERMATPANGYRGRMK